MCIYIQYFILVCTVIVYPNHIHLIVMHDLVFEYVVQPDEKYSLYT